MRLVLDVAARRVEGGRVLLGGVPFRVLRLAPAGARVLDRLLDEGDDSSAGRVLARRLLDDGLAHPVIDAGSLPDRTDSVEVVVPVRGDQAKLDRLLGTLAGLAVCVVDDGSSPPIVVPPGVRLLRRSSSGGPGAARERGWRSSSAEVIVFLDADTRPSDGWLGPLLAHLAEPTVVAAAPRVRSTNVESVVGRHDAVRSPLDLGPDPGSVVPMTRRSYVPTAALVVRRSALEAVGGFDPGLRYGEDVDLVWRLHDGGGVVRYEPASTVWHEPRRRLAAMARQRFAYGSSAAPLSRRHPTRLAPFAAAPESAMAVALAASGSLGPSVLVLGWSTVRFVRRFEGREARRAAVGIAVGGHVMAFRHAADAVRRPWWPLALGLARMVPAVRPAVALAWLAPLAEPSLRRRPWRLPVRWLDDAAYGAGVWWGMARARTVRPLRPRFGRLRP